MLLVVAHVTAFVVINAGNPGLKCRGEGGCQSAQKGWKADDLGVKSCLALVRCIKLGKLQKAFAFKMKHALGFTSECKVP